MARIQNDRWVANLHPRNIPVTKSALREMLRSYNHLLCRALCCALAIGEEHPRFQEWLTKACYHLQMIGSFVYIVPYPDGRQNFTRRTIHRCSMLSAKVPRSAATYWKRSAVRTLGFSPAALRMS